MLTKNNYLGVGITNETIEDILEYIENRLKKGPKFFIVTPNPEILVYASKNPTFKMILNEAEIALPDGTGLFLASILRLNPFKQRIPGVDFMKELCEKPISIGLLGGKPGIADRVAQRLKVRNSHLKVEFVGEEWPTADEIKDLRLKNPKSYLLNLKSIDILFVAFGHPKQEEWIYKNLDQLPIKAAMGVGGSFDYISGEVKRAPFMVRAVGFEWLYRLIKQPWRFKRQLALLEFVKLIFKEQFQR